MKYKLRDKRKRNELLFKCHLDNPELTMSEIGEIFSISKQRVKVIVDGMKDKQQAGD